MNSLTISAADIGAVARRRCPKLTEAEVWIVRAERRTGGVSCADLSRRYGVGESCIRDIWTGRTWKKLLPEGESGS